MATHSAKLTAGLITSGIFLILGLFFFFFVTAYRFTGVIFMGISAVILSYCLLRLLAINHVVLAKTLRLILSSGLAICILFAAVTGTIIALHGQSQSHTASRYIIVLGAGVDGTEPSLSLSERLDAAYRYLKRHPDSIAILSGGQGDGEEITEAACMYADLIARGIPERQLRKENRASSTAENIRFSLDLIEEETGTRPNRVGLVSNEYHIHRACMIAAKQGVSASGIPAHSTHVTLKINYFLREIAAVWYYSVFGG